MKPASVTLTPEGARLALETKFRVALLEQEINLHKQNLALKDTIIAQLGRANLQLKQLVKTASKSNDSPPPPTKPPFNWARIENWGWRILFVTLAVTATTTALTK
ncbi:hypothetical protein GCM10027347_44600 [Larkinella harenae]